MTARFVPGVVAAALAAAVLAALVQLRRADVTLGEVVSAAVARQPSATDLRVDTPAVSRAPRLDAFTRRALGEAVGPDERPMIASVAIVDLDRDGLMDIVAADAAANRITWMRQAPAGRFLEQTIADVPGPAHVHAADLDGDGDLDLAVASLGVLTPTDWQIGAVVLLEHDGRGGFTPHRVLEGVARVADVRSGDLDGDGDLDLSVAQCGDDQGETRWLENTGGWHFESHLLQQLSGPANAEIVDIDGDRDLDIVTLVGQPWQEVYVFVNDGGGRFTPRRIFGASNEDFGSNGISIADLDGDGDPDVVYSNGGAGNCATTSGRPWHGLQWLENTGGGAFTYHRLADIAGAAGPQAADLDGDGDLDIAVVSARNDWADPNAQSLVVLEQTSRGVFTLRGVAGAPTHLRALAIGDLTGDGRPDLVTGGMHTSWPYDRRSRLMLWTNRWRGAP